MRLNIGLQRLLDNLGIDRLPNPFADFACWRWRRKGRPAPAPPSVKRQILREYAAAHRLRVLVETGTFLGGTVRAMLPHFEEIFSIELSEPLYRRAVARFRRHRTVKLLHGDSATQLPLVLEHLRTPALFWLDGHYSAGFTARGSKETPIVEELETVLQSTAPHVVLIDDARLFDGTRDYPTMQALQALVERIGGGHSVTVADDIIRVVPANAP